MKAVGRDARNSSWDVLVALHKTSSAKGDLYLDDGISVQPNATLTAQFVVQNRTMSTTISHGGWVDGNSLRNVTIWGVDRVDSVVKSNGGNTSRANVHFDRNKHTLVVTGRNVSAWAGTRWTLEW